MKINKGKFSPGLFLFSLVLIFSIQQEYQNLEIEGTQVAMITLKSCQGWCLKKFKVAKLFIEQDFDHYDPSLIKMDKLGGGFPRLVLTDEEGENIKTYNISKISRKQIRNVFMSLQISLVKPLKPLNEVDMDKVVYHICIII